MPSARKHLRSAERHLLAADAGCQSDVTRSWAAVALFYSSHQLVHAVLDGHPGLGQELRHPTAHGGQAGTNLIVSRLFREIDTAYKSLFGTSTAVRYYGQVVDAADYGSRRNDDFEKIGQWAVRQLRNQGREVPSFL